MNSDNDSAIWRTFWLALLVLAVTAGVAACGAPVINSTGLSWDNSLWSNREAQRTERERLRLAAETRQALERERTAQIMSENMMATLQWLAVVGGAVGGLAIAGWTVQRSFAAWSARPHRNAGSQQIEVRISYEQAQRLAQPHLLALPGSRLEWIDGAFVDGAWVEGWTVVDDEREIVRPLQLTDSLPPAR